MCRMWWPNVSSRPSVIFSCASQRLIILLFSLQSTSMMFDVTGSYRRGSIVAHASNCIALLRKSVEVTLESVELALEWLIFIFKRRHVLAVCFVRLFIFNFCMDVNHAVQVAKELVNIFLFLLFFLAIVAESPGLSFNL